MLDIRLKKEVTTRKEHKCHLCKEPIEKGAKAVNIKAKEDEKHVNLYLHIPCNVEANRIDFFDENLVQNATKQNSLDETAYPF